MGKARGEEIEVKLIVILLHMSTESDYRLKADKTQSFFKAKKRFDIRGDNAVLPITTLPTCGLAGLHVPNNGTV